mmetsp:Transcript_4212/g.10290  ORF Transcript_4212/g.10290 Transcript_4212/m.10290 type:complete len:224 (+) Transcript_4212:923-1594(+)
MERMPATYSFLHSMSLVTSRGATRGSNWSTTLLQCVFASASPSHTMSVPSVLTEGWFALAGAETSTYSQRRPPLMSASSPSSASVSSCRSMLCVCITALLMFDSGGHNNNDSGVTPLEWVIAAHMDWMVVRSSPSEAPRATNKVRRSTPSLNARTHSLSSAVNDLGHRAHCSVLAVLSPGSLLSLPSLPSSRWRSRACSVATLCSNSMVRDFFFSRYRRCASR